MLRGEIYFGFYSPQSCFAFLRQRDNKMKLSKRRKYGLFDGTPKKATEGTKAAQRKWEDEKGK